MKLTNPGVKIRRVEDGSLADELGLEEGDEILAINGHPVSDELALKFFLAEGRVKLNVRKTSGRVLHAAVEAEDGCRLGIEVEDFRTRTCTNACVFCFVNQLPPGVRASLTIKDDDYRLSFLHGNYITLTNLSYPDLDRIIEQALSPLFVSVHATDPALRTRIMGRKRVDDFAGKLRRLVDGGVSINAQIVLMPGVNDGEHLAQTIFDLFAFHPGVNSVAVVPLGLSEHGAAHTKLTPVTAPFCRSVVLQVAPWQRQFRQVTGKTFVYLADEFYIQGGVPIPDAEAYDDFAQIEDGVGMVRYFLDDFASHLKKQQENWSGLRASLATGSLFFPFLADCASRLNKKMGSELSAVEVPNRFMGKSITVAGLLAGRDFVDALSRNQTGDFVIIPGEALSQSESIFVDGMSVSDLGRIVGKPVYPGGRSVHEFFRILARHIGDAGRPKDRSRPRSPDRGRALK